MTKIHLKKKKIKYNRYYPCCFFLQSSDFESTVRYVSCAFCNLKESEAIKGLYVWCRNVANVKLSYLIALSDQAAGR